MCVGVFYGVAFSIVASCVHVDYVFFRLKQIGVHVLLSSLICC